MKNKKTNKYLLVGMFFASLIYLKFIVQFSWPIVLLIYFALITLFLLINFGATAAFIGNYFFNTGKSDRARDIFRFCIKHNSKYPTVYLNYSIMLVKEGRAEEALGYLEKALLRTPKIITEKNIRLTMGSCYWVLGEIDRAIEVLEELRSRFEYVNEHVLTTLAYMYFLKGDNDKALDLTQKAIEDTPSHGAAWDNLGQIYYKTDKMPEAKEAFLKALEYKSDLVDSLYYLAQVLERENDFQGAKEYYEKAKVCKITALNTVSTEQINEGYEKCIARIGSDK